MPALPILQNGALRTDAGFLLLGHMAFPNDTRDAWTLAEIVMRETYASAKNPALPESYFFKQAAKALNLPLRTMVSRTALRFLADALDGSRPSLSKAAFAVSEVYTSETTADGKPMPTDERRIRKEFVALEKALHFWAAAEVRWTHGETKGSVLNLMTIRPNVLLDFLVLSEGMAALLDDFREPIERWSPPPNLWNLVDFEKAPIARRNSAPEVFHSALRKYRARSGW